MGEKCKICGKERPGDYGIIYMGIPLGTKSTTTTFGTGYQTLSTTKYQISGPEKRYICDYHIKRIMRVNLTVFLVFLVAFIIFASLFVYGQLPQTKKARRDRMITIAKIYPEWDRILDNTTFKARLEQGKAEKWEFMSVLIPRLKSSLDVKTRLKKRYSYTDEELAKMKNDIDELEKLTKTPYIWWFIISFAVASGFGIFYYTRNADEERDKMAILNIKRDIMDENEFVRYFTRSEYEPSKRLEEISKKKQNDK